MAVTITAVAGAKHREGNKRVGVFDLVFSGNYATGGESVTASSLGFHAVDEVRVHGGVAVAGNLASAHAISYDYPTSKFTFYSSAAVAGAVLPEKTNAEAYPAGSKCRISVVGW